MNESQALAIERELTILRDKNRDYEEFFEAENNFLITNLESIQGDEKEVIFISIGYGFSRDGRLTLQFGPISKVGGTRRLNVLTTRAKKRCVVFSSIRGRDIFERNPTNEGALFLARYLEYAEIGRMNVYEENQQAYYQQESYQQKKSAKKNCFSSSTKGSIFKKFKNYALHCKSTTKMSEGVQKKKKPWIWHRIFIGGMLSIN
ncbi:MAG: DNA2/NAM7 family helicase [bacterium]|nr:DNA2/NAM7 family helicase [bacterium]